MPESNTEEGPGFWRGFHIVPGNAPLRRPGLYVITHIKSGRKYAGKAKNVHRRLLGHTIGRATRCMFITRAILKYGRKAFLVTPIAYSIDPEDIEWLPEAEMALIQTLGTLAPAGFNKRLAADGGLREVDHFRVLVSRAVKKAYADLPPKFWITNGARERRISGPIPAGWRAGRTSRGSSVYNNGQLSQLFPAGTKPPGSWEPGSIITAERRMITNGTTSRWIHKGDKIPRGWRRGKARTAKMEAYFLSRRDEGYITNGVTSRRIVNGSPIPKGWKRGRTW